MITIAAACIACFVVMAIVGWNAWRQSLAEQRHSASLPSVLEDYPGGYVIRCHENGHEFSSDVARVRLDDTIKADRATVPCGRWVPHVPGVFYPGKVGSLPFKVKPRWRWVAR